ncbi:lysozyme [Citromicrobium bathyomarinum]|uniref:lysozyme n=1 Tax=Sphingomonadales TaxID=204457 RepID=UPI0026B25DB5|tara:strand:- start:13660 stop:14424 length:765 start_codon:yes stop_codon:yes gene_type:complete
MSAATAMSPVRDRRRSDQRARLQAMREGGQPGQTSGRTRKWRRRLLRRTPIAIAAVSAAAGSLGAYAPSQTAEDVGGWSYETNLKTNPNYTRMNAALLTTSERMRKALAQEEGMRLTVYRDVAGYPTVGIGHLVLPEDGLRVGDRITREQAMDFLAADLAKAERAVADVVGNLKLYQHEFDALVDLAYNVGEGTLSPAKSPALNRAIASADYEGIAQELDYRFADGQVAGGLVHRSERRAQIFLEADYADVRPG